MSSSLAHVLTDVDSDIWADRFACSHRQLPLTGAAQWHIEKRTLHGGLTEGVDLVELDNGAMSVDVLPTRGCGLFRIRAGEQTFGFPSPVAQPVHPKFVNLAERGGLGWLYGFNELLCRCGLAFNGPPCTDGGEPLTLHGRIANLPARFVEVGADAAGKGTLWMRATVDEDYLFGPGLRLNTTLRLEAGAHRLSIIDEIENRAGGPRSFELLYHINVGRPVLEAGAKFHMPMQQIAPRDETAAEGIDDVSVYPPPTAGFAEEAYFIQPATDADGQSVALLHNARHDLGFAVRFNTEQLPWFTLWKCTQADQEGYITGLEPGVNLPNPRPFEREQNRVPTLAAGEVHRAELVLELLIGQDRVQAVTDEITEISQAVSTEWHRQPHKDLCAGVR